MIIIVTITIIAIYSNANNSNNDNDNDSNSTKLFGQDGLVTPLALLAMSLPEAALLVLMRNRSSTPTRATSRALLATAPAQTHLLFARAQGVPQHFLVQVADDIYFSCLLTPVY